MQFDNTNNSACIIPDSLTFFDKQYSAYTDDMMYVADYLMDESLTHQHLSIKPSTEPGGTVNMDIRTHAPITDISGNDRSARSGLGLNSHHHTLPSVDANPGQAIAGHLGDTVAALQSQANAAPTSTGTGSMNQETELKFLRKQLKQARAELNAIRSQRQ